MTHPRPRAFPLCIAAALAAFLLLSELPAAGQDSTQSATGVTAATDQECLDKWEESATADGAMCEVEADCLVFVVASAPIVDSGSPGQADETYSFTAITATPDKVARLHNCSGALTVGSC